MYIRQIIILTPLDQFSILYIISGPFKKLTVLNNLFYFDKCCFCFNQKFGMEIFICLVLIWLILTILGKYAKITKLKKKIMIIKKGQIRPRIYEQVNSPFPFLGLLMELDWNIWDDIFS